MNYSILCVQELHQNVYRVCIKSLQMITAKQLMTLKVSISLNNSRSSRKPTIIVYLRTVSDMYDSKNS